MAVTVVYAVGGTGAKLLEALIHLCAAGLVSRDLLVRMVDQDKGNGNAQRVRGLVADYEAVYGWLRGSDTATADHDLFKAAVDGAEGTINVVPDLDETLASAFGLGQFAGAGSGEDDLLMQALFSPEERSATMVNGFRGQPSVGAAVFLSSRSREKSALWTTIDSDVAKARDGDVDQFLLLGSSFGGTGASGVPTIANYLRSALHNTVGPRIGAVLMLRYFGVVGTSNYGPAAPAKVKAAMEFYHQVMNRDPGERLVDSLYLVGLDRELEVPAERLGGGRDQLNPALMPELIAALGAMHFLGRHDLAQTGRGLATAAQGKPLWLCGRATDSAVLWPDLPVPRAANGVDARRRLCSFARFAICYSYGLHPAEFLSKVPHTLDQPIYLALLDRRRLTLGEYDEQALSLSLFLQRFLRWFGAMHSRPKDDQGRTRGTAIRLDLGVFDELVEPAPTADDRVKLRFDPAKLATYRSDQLRALDDVFSSIWPEKNAPSLAQVLANMSKSSRRPDRRRSFAGFVNAAYAAAELPTERGA